MKIVTFNVRCMYRSLDKENCFIHRAGMILDTIAEEKPDVICFQEATPENMGFLRRYLKPDYTLLLNQREEGLTGEGLAVAFRQETCSLYGLDIFWMSPTPEVIASKFPGQSKHSRICQRLLFKNEETGSLFKIYNLHTEELSEDVRVQQVSMVMDRAEEETVPVVILGDMNSSPIGQVLPTFLNHGYEELTKDIPITFHGFGQRDPGYKLDYVFAKPETAAKITDVRPWDQCLNGIYLSDHYPISFQLDV